MTLEIAPETLRALEGKAPRTGVPLPDSAMRGLEIGATAHFPCISSSAPLAVF